MYFKTFYNLQTWCQEDWTVHQIYAIDFLDCARDIIIIIIIIITLGWERQAVTYVTVEKPQTERPPGISCH